MVVDVVHFLDVALQRDSLGRRDLTTTIDASGRASHDFHIVIGAEALLYFPQHSLDVSEPVCQSKAQHHPSLHLQKTV